MAARTIINVESPTTQSVKAVCALLAWKGRSSNPLPQFVELGSGEGRVVLVLSNKKDCFYVVTDRECSCPAHNYHPGQRCKHMRKHFAEQATARPAQSIIPERRSFKPIAPDEAQAATFELVDCLPDPSPRDLAYHSIQEDKAMWPAEA